MLSKQYGDDCEYVARQAIEYAKGLKLGGDEKDVWVFDVDDTVLSNLPFFARPDIPFGSDSFGTLEFGEWLAAGNMPAIPSIFRVYNTVLSLGIKPVFLTGAPEYFREARTLNLKRVGYSNWLKLILKGDNDPTSAIEYKSIKRTELVKEGYRIVGNTGDQWTDLIGENVGARTFKVPNPMYYVG
ncbi:unnamed protein product [Withania somnifera]